MYLVLIVYWSLYLSKHSVNLLFILKWSSKKLWLAFMGITLAITLFVYVPKEKLTRYCLFANMSLSSLNRCSLYD